MLYTMFPGGRENCSDNDVRLVGGQNEREGVVQICYKGVWGVECDELVYYLDIYVPFLKNEENAKVVCRQLGFLEPNGSKSKISKGISDNVYIPIAHTKCLYYIPGTFSIENGDYAAVQGPILLGDVVCEGDEYKLSKCDHNGIGIHSCHGHVHLAIICPGSISGQYSKLYVHRYSMYMYVVLSSGSCTHGSVRLVGGQSKEEGRVEACFEGHWFPVDHEGWSEREAKVVCQQLQLLSPSSRNIYCIILLACTQQND